jgi:hypothetical protein
MRARVRSVRPSGAIETAIRLLPAAFVLALAACACGGGGGLAQTPAQTPTSTPPAASSGASNDSTPASAPEDAASAASAPGPGCGRAQFLPILKRALDDDAAELRIVQARVERCRDGYAQVFAIPDTSVCQPGIGSCYETEQVLLRWRGAVWRFVASGSGIACGAEGETAPAIVRICRALGYPDLGASG